jgi:hypothetical protein
MNRYGNDRYGRNDSDEEEDYDDPEEELNEDVKDNHLKQNRIIYTNDGLTETNYRYSNIPKKDLTKCESCLRYFNADGYEHQNKYGYQIPGMIICIHCHISFNLDKYGNCKNLSKKDEELLTHYIEKFTEEHISISCSRNEVYGKCLLCQSKLGIKPAIIAMAKTNNEINVKLLETKISENVIISNDLAFVDRKDKSDFVLTL